MRPIELLGRALGRNRSFPERAGILSASALVGQTFARGLLPRSPLHQAAITGTSAMIQYSSTTTLQSLIYDVSMKITSRASTESRQRWQQDGFVIGANLAALGAGTALALGFPQRPNESVGRAVARTAGIELLRAGAAGAIVANAQRLLDRVERDYVKQLPIAAPIGGALAATVFLLNEQKERRYLKQEAEESGVEVDISPLPDIQKSLLIGAGVSVGLVVLARGEQFITDRVAKSVVSIAPGMAPLSRPLGHLVALGVFGGALGYGINFAYAKTQTAGLKHEAAYAAIPENPNVSGSAHSLVSFDSLGREGRRWVSMVLGADEIEQVMGEPAMDPIRVFVGLESYPGIDPSGRVRLAMEELERTGAFSRKTICVFSPTGTGYVNPVTSESLEYYTRGDVASVAVQYSVRPSFLSLQAVHIARDGLRLLLAAIASRLAAIPEADRPRLLIFGESLGAQSGQDVLAGTRKGQGRPITAFADDYGIDRALFIGTPFASKWHQEYVADPEFYDPQGELVTVDSHDEWQALPADQQAAGKYLLLSHHTDPITKFGPILIVQKPDWLGEPESRAPGIPRSTVWRFWVTFISTFVDVLNADQHKPGIFEARGHDYSADLGKMTAVAFDLQVSDDQWRRAEVALRDRQLAWAQKREVSQELADAVDRIESQLEKWGAEPGTVLKEKLDQLSQQAALEIPDPSSATPETPAVDN